MGYETIRFDVANGVAILTLDRPDVLNSFTVEMHREIRAALKQMREDASIRALLITGAGRAFSAGQDLNEGDPGSDWGADLTESLDRNYNRLVKTLRALELPVVCAVNGIAAGAGANLALACDIVLAARSASFIQAFIRIGLIPDAGGTYMLPRLVGKARATGLAMLGEAISAETAEAWGLIWRCVDDERLMDEAKALAERLAAQPTRALALMKRAFDTSGVNTLAEQLDLERDLQSVALRTEDCKEGVAAFLDKREASFKGR